MSFTYPNDGGHEEGPCPGGGLEPGESSSQPAQEEHGEGDTEQGVEYQEDTARGRQGADVTVTCGRSR